MNTAEIASSRSQDSETPGTARLLAAAPACCAPDDSRPPPEAARRYLSRLLEDFDSPPSPGASAACGRLAETIFGLQTRREFCYLSGTRVAPYREAALARIGECIDRGEPVHYGLDIGGGYHASLRPGIEDLCFDVGLGEWLLLRQIRRFDRAVRRVFPAGTRFSLVIDNLVAWLVNEIPVASTQAYCARLRELIARVGMAGEVSVWVESEHLSPADFERQHPACRIERRAEDLSGKEHETVERFLGRPCGSDEAALRTARYGEVTAISGRLIDERLHALRMTQRATPGTICFRPFPGADSRIQSGQVALRLGAGDEVLPMLLTSRNQQFYDWRRVTFSAMLPAMISQVICADPAPLTRN